MFRFGFLFVVGFALILRGGFVIYDNGWRGIAFIFPGACLCILAGCIEL